MQQTVETHKGSDIPERAVPCPLHQVEEASAFCPEWLEDEPLLAGVLHV
jgi:hypothetical protein